MNDQQQVSGAVKKGDRRQQILEALATQLEQNPGERITTAQLAGSMNISEAALYRHFPSKARMFEGLIGFAEETVFSLASRILENEPDAVSRIEKMMALLLGFSAKNPGISSVLVGVALTGETERLRHRASQFFDRLESQFKQILRERELSLNKAGGRPVNETAKLLLAIIEGQMQQYVRSGYRHSPLTGWDQQWLLVRQMLTAYL